MTSKIIGIYILALLLSSCKTPPNADMKNIEVGISFIDAFYSFNKDSLASILSDAEKSQPEILYYQKWAECANYKVLDRSHYFERNDSVVVFPVTVKDDLMSALAIDFNVTDTFHISIKNGKITSTQLCGTCIISINNLNLKWLCLRNSRPSAYIFLNFCLTKN